MSDSDDRPNELARWTARLDELFAKALERVNCWRDGKSGSRIETPNPDIKGAVEVVRLALTLHGALAIPTHGLGCRCPKCARVIETAEDAVRSRLRRAS